MNETIYPSSDIIGDTMKNDDPQLALIRDSVQNITHLWQESDAKTQQILENPFSSPAACYARIMLYIWEGI